MLACSVVVVDAGVEVVGGDVVVVDVVDPGPVLPIGVDVVGDVGVVVGETIVVVGGGSVVAVPPPPARAMTGAMGAAVGAEVVMPVADSTVLLG